VNVFSALLLLLSAAAYAAVHHPRNGAELTAILETASPGDRIDLGDHRFSGNFNISKTLSITGAGAVLDGEGAGSVLTLNAPAIRLEGLQVRGSGADLRGPDSGIYLTPKANCSKLVSNQVEDCAFGIWVHVCSDVHLIDNTVNGRNTGHPSNRGNGIQLFDCTAVTVKGNKVRHGRDGIYVSATEESLIEANEMEQTRYGIHYMYSYSNTVRHNICRNNNNGYALMESKHLLVEDNLSENNKGQGLQFRDAQYCVIRRNRLIGNKEGMFFYSSTNNEITDNLVQGNAVGAKIWAGSLRNAVFRNRFIANKQQLFYVGSTEIEWGHEGQGNYWSDYLGWDQDGDGVGERPYRVNSFSSRLMYRFPAAAVLMSSPSLETLSLLEQRLPALRTPTITDRHPLLREAE
jgi:nitrous oxidase accessory protein